ncbi:MAG: cupin domain-containing protein [Candidatus Puniceispirillum sp.]
MPTPKAIQPADRSSAPHYQWGDGGMAWRLLDKETLGVFEETLAPGTGEEMHYHLRAEQCFYMLSGVAKMRVGNKILTLDEGTATHIPAGTAHAISNASAMEIRFLVISTPSTYGDRQIVSAPS